MAPSTAARWIQLNYDDQEGKVVVTPQNQDRFVISARDAAEACQMAHDRDTFIEQFNRLLSRLGAWLKEKQGEFLAAFVTVREGGLLFVVVRSEARYDDAFEEELTRLDLEIAQHKDFDHIDLNVLALPRASETAYASFLHPEHTWEFRHGK